MRKDCDDYSDRVFPLRTNCNPTDTVSVYVHIYCNKYVESLLKENGLSSTDNFSAFMELLKLCTDIISEKEYLYDFPEADNETYFTCERSRKCLHPKLVCDGHPQCEYSEDEDLQMCYDTYIALKIIQPFASLTCQNVMYPNHPGIR